MKISKKGFTLVEMLVVIAVIAVLVAVVLPTVSIAERKAKAAADAANLRSVLGQMNVEILQEKPVADVSKEITPPESQYAPGAEIQILYVNPGFVEVYYVKDQHYYGLEFLTDLVEHGSTDKPSQKPASPGTWYKVGTGSV